MKNIDICFGVGSYFPYMSATMTSLLTNEDERFNITFHVISSGITNDDKNRILSLKSIRDFDIKFYTIDTERYKKWFEKMDNERHFTPSIFFRLSIPKLLKDVDKVLYTDCDVIYTKSIGHLFEQDIDNYYAIVLDEYESHGNDEIKKILGLSSDYKSFNPSFILINNKLWIDNNIEKDFAEYAGSRDILYLGDFGILNYVLSRRKLKYIPLTYNCLAHTKYYEKNEFSIPKIDELFGIHYLTDQKPWKENCPNLLFVDEFWKYFSLTPWFREDTTKYINIMIKQEVHKESSILSLKLDKVIDTLAWWIPLRKLRDAFRAKFK